MDRAPDSAGAAEGAARKTVTVLFADLVGSTSFGERVDAESVRDTLAGYHVMARRVIEDHDGVLAKFIGDGVMALFGVPDTSEDDALRAVAAGVALQSEFAALAGRVEQQHGVGLGLRVGINTGEVVISADDDDLVGDAVNTAARLESACSPGQVLVGESTWRSTRATVAYEELDPIGLKGKADPVASYQVVSTAGLEDDAPTPFVGRATELARVRSVFDDAVSDRVARLATVIGSPGVGKTRLARELSSSVSEVAAVAEMRCRRSGTATFAPIADVLRTTAGIADGDSPDAIRNSIGELVADLDDADRVADLLTSFLDDGSVRSTEEAFFAVRRLTEAMARLRPVVVVVDDIQWAEPLFLDLLEHLAEWVSDAPVLILSLARPEIRDIRPSFTTESRTLRAVVQLEGLDAGDTAELASRLVGSGTLPPELLGRLPASTEGNPLFVRELMKMLVDDGVIIEVGGAWELTIEADAVEVPPTIQSLLSARVDRLPPDERRLIELASVVGSEFPLGAVQAIAPPETIEPDLRAAMDRLRRRELVEPADRYWGDEAVFRFHHALIRDAAYRRILKRRRANLHVGVGEWTERTAGGLPGEHDASIGYHFECAYGYLRELSADEAEVRPIGRTAARLLGVAAQRSLERDDVAAAGGLAERAVACLGPDDPEVADLLLVGCEALLAVGDVARGSELVGRLRGVGEDARMRAWAECFDAQLAVLTEPDRLQEVVRQLDATAGALADVGDRSGVAKARLVRAQAFARLGHIGECESELDVALTAARGADDRRSVAAVLGAAPVAALWGPSPIPRAGGRCLDVIRLLRITGGSPAVEAVSTRCQAVLEALRGRLDTARSMLAEARSTVEEFGLRHGVLETEFYGGIIELLAGEPDAAEPRLRAAYEGLDRLGLGADAGHAAAYLARALLQLGRVDEADETARAAERRAGQNPQTGISARAVRAEVSASRGVLDEAVTLAGAAVQMAAATDLVVDHADANAVLALVAEAAGEDATAQRAQRQATALEEGKGIVSAAMAADSSLIDEQASVGVSYPPGAGCVVIDRTTTDPTAAVAFPESVRRRVLGTWRDAVSLSELRADEGFRRLAVEEFEPSGELTRVTLFAVTTAAVGDAAELADLRYASLPSAPASYSTISRCTYAMQRRDSGAFDDLTDRDFVFVDHRPMGFPTLTKAELVDLYREMPIPVGFFVGDMVVVASRGLVYRGAQLTVSPSGQLDESMPACALVVANDRIVERMEWFAEYETDRAIARLNELSGTRRVSGDGPIVVDRTTADLDGQIVIPTSIRRRVLGTWQAPVSLVELRDDEGFHRFAVEESGPSGELNRVTLFAPTTEGLWEASEFSELRVAELVAVSPSFLAISRFSDAMQHRDARGMEEHAEPDLALVDHRAIGLPSLTRDELAEVFRSMDPLADEPCFVGDELDGDVHGLVFRGAQLSVTPDGELVESMPACVVLVANDRRVERMEWFAETDADAAIAHFRELAPTDRDRPVIVDHAADEDRVEPAAIAAAGRRDVDVWHPDVSIIELHSGHDAFRRFAVEETDDDGERLAVDLYPVTTAGLAEASKRFSAIVGEASEHPAVWRLTDEFGTAVSAFDLDALDRLVTPDFVALDHRALPFPAMDRSGFLDAIRSVAEVPGSVYVGDEPLVFTERGLVQRMIAVTVRPDGSFDEQMPGCVVMVTNGHQIERVEMYDEDDAGRAVARFHELTEEAASRGGDCVVVDHATGRTDVDIAALAPADRRELEAWHPKFSLVELRDDQRAFRRFAVEDLDSDGSPVAVDLYPHTTEGLASAAECYERKVGDTSEYPVVWHLLAEFGAAVGRFDVELSYKLSPDYRVVDHRPLGLPEMDRDTFVGAAQSVEGIPATVAIGREPLLFTERGIVQFAVSVSVGPDAELDEQMPSILVITTDGRQIERVEMFAEDDADAAVARFHELTASRSHGGVPVNQAVRAGQRMTAAARDNALAERADDLFEPDFVRRDRRTIVSTGELDVGGMQDSYTDVVPHLSFESIAVRGDRFHLAAGTTDDGNDRESRYLLLDEAGPTGRTQRTTMFDGDALDDAIAELDQQWFLSLTDAEQRAMQVGARYGRAAATWDLPEFEELTTADFAYYDGTPLGAGWLDRQRFLESQRLQGELFGPQTSRVFDVVELPRPDVILSRVSSTGTAQRWHGDWERQLTMVVQIVRDRVHRFGLFAYDDLVTARAWASSLDAEPRSDPGLDTLSTRMARRLRSAMNDGSLGDRLDEFFEPGWQRYDHRSVISTGAIDASTMAESLMTVDLHTRSTHIAARGDHFLLTHGTTDYGDDNETSYLVLSEITLAGRQLSTDLFDEDALDVAMAELDRRWTATLSEVERDNLATLDAWSRTYDEDDTVAFDRLLGPGFWFDDRQQLGAGVLDRDGMLAFHRRSGEVHGPSSGRQRHAIRFPSPAVAIVNTTVSGQVSDGDRDWRKSLWLVAELGGGRVHHTAGFDADQRESALRYAANIASERQDVAVCNRAVHIVDRIVRRLDAGVGMTREMLADGFVWSRHGDDREERELDSDALLTDPGGWLRPGAHLRYQPIAVRDDHVMLAHAIDEEAGDPTGLMLVVADDHDRLVRVAEFGLEALDEARSELERSWWATLSADERATVRVAGEFGRAFQEQDRERFARVLSPDFVAVEHYDLGLGEMDREQYLSSHQGRNDLFGPSLQVYDVAALPSPGVMIVRTAVIISPDDAGWEDVAWNVLQVRDGRLIRLELYAEFDPHDDRPRHWAYRRAREIIGDVASGST